MSSTQGRVGGGCSASYYVQEVSVRNFTWNDDSGLLRRWSGSVGSKCRNYESPDDEKNPIYAVMTLWAIIARER